MAILVHAPLAEIMATPLAPPKCKLQNRPCLHRTLKLRAIECSGLASFRKRTRRPASTDRTARRQFQATGQPVSRTQDSDAMTSRLPRYEAKCAQRRCFQCGSVPLRSDIKGTELPPANILIPLERQLVDCATTLPLTVFTARAMLALQALY